MKKILSILLIFFATSLFAKSDCDDKVFSSLTASKGATISQMLDQLSYKCSFSVVIKDGSANRLLDKQLNSINLRDFTLKEVLDFLLTDNELDYEYQNGILKVSSYTTKTFKVDYITAVRSADTTFSMGAGAAGGSTGTSGTSNNGQMASTSLGSTFKAEDKDLFFWKSIENDLAAILNPESAAIEHSIEWKSESKDKNAVLGTSDYSNNQKRSESVNIKTNSLIINPQAGLITVTAPKVKLDKAEKYLESVMERLHQQVFIDVQILSVSLNKTHTTGIDWGKVYSAAGVKASYGSLSTINTPTVDTSTGVITSATSGGGGLAQYFRVNGGVDLTDFVKFLQTQGDVKTVSNPKVMTLNNQPALITSGDVIFYPKVSGGTSATATTGATNPTVEAIPLNVGVTLDITPEVMNNSEIMLKINPTTSNCLVANCTLQTVQVAGTAYNIAPNIAQKQLSSVIRVADGEKIILGGLIKDSKGTDTSKLPLLGDIPLLGYLFKQDVDARVMEELVIIITPRIVKKDKAISLKDLGYKSELDKQEQQ